MKAPTQQQLNDPAWWDENAPEGATHFFPPSGDWYKDAENGLECWAASLGFWVPAGFPDRLEDRLAVERPTKPQAPEWDDMPDAYMCPAGCGCLWRDNGDDTMSLYGPKSQSCDVCEPLPLNRLVPVKKLRTQAERERDELQEDLDGILPFVEFDPGQIKELAAILYAQGYRKPDAGTGKGDS